MNESASSGSRETSESPSNGIHENSDPTSSGIRENSENSSGILTNSATPPPGAASRTKRRLGVSAALAVVLAAAGFSYSWYRSLPLRELPGFDVSHADPAVKKAIQSAREAVLASPRSGAAWGELGQYLEAHAFHQQAQLCLAQAMRFDPQKFLWPYLRGVILNIRDPSEAERCFRQAARLRPKLALPRVRLAELFLEQRRLDQAAQEYHEAIRIEPEDPRAMFGLGQIAYIQADFAQAGRWAEQSFALDPRQRKPAELLLKVAHRLGDKATVDRRQAVLDALAARADAEWADPFTKELTMKRRDLRGMAATATELLENGWVSEAIAAYVRLVEREPANPLWHSLLGSTLIRHGDFARAAQVLAAGLALHPRSAELHFNRALVYFFLGEWAAAADQYRKAVELKGDFGDAQYNLGQALVKLGDREGALAAFRETLRIRPDDAASYANLGKLLLESGDRDAARGALENAAKLAPQDTDIRQQLEALRSDESK